ncbi:unnamed protein product [Pipistrellus nathusii]|uniref:Uncharacterized protein n=1 Tax=Pipistrellus nathusii TaxID=59473 RepID=A0ABP0A7N2_PIPNA
MKSLSLLENEGMTVKPGKEQKGIGGQENEVEEGGWRAEGILRTLGESAEPTGQESPPKLSNDSVFVHS